MKDIIIIFAFVRPHLWHMEVTWLGGQKGATSAIYAIATTDP